MIDLIFSEARLSGTPTPLVFGGADFAVPSITVDVAVTLGGVKVTASLVHPVKVNAALTLGGVSVAAFVVTPVRVEAAFALGGVTVSAAVFYDNRVTPYLDARSAVPHQAAVPGTTQLDGIWLTSLPKRDGKEAPWDKAEGRVGKVAAVHETPVPKRSGVAAPWDIAIKKAQVSAAAHQRAIAHTVSRADGYALGDDRRIDTTSAMQTGIFHVLPKTTGWQPAIPRLHVHQGRSGASLHFSGRLASALYQLAGYMPPGQSLPPVVPPVVPPTFWWGRDLLFEFGPSDTNLVFGYTGETILPIGNVVVPVRRVYMVINNASLRRVDGNIAIPVFGMSLSIEADSWAWSFSATLPAHVLSDIEPDYAGAPVEVEALINGVAYRALIERIGRSREFGKSGISVSGRGRTALLDTPYAPVQNFVNATSRTAQQIMGDVLSVNGVPMDWTLDWQLEDWVVPGGVFSHQGSYIAALNAIAAAAGGYIQPHASLQTLHVLPRYATAPWAWAGVTPDFTLPSDVTTREGIEWVERARYNRVFVSGQQAGVLGQVTRAGTAGDIVAPMVTDALITTAAAARQRGLSILANTGRVAEVSLRLPVLAETGVITPGKFVEYTDAGVTRRGVVRSVGVEVGMPEIWQNLGVETYA